MSPHNDFSWIISLDYRHLGCWKERNTPKLRTMTILDGLDFRLNGIYTTRPDAINTCFTVARERGHRIFAIVHGGKCLASNDLNRYKRYGKANNCRNFKGGFWSNDVYLILQPLVHESKFLFLPSSKVEALITDISKIICVQGL